MSKPTTHKVVSGDTLSALAKKYGTTVKELKDINGLKSDLIKIGQTLKLPVVVQNQNKPKIIQNKAIVFFVGGAADRHQYYFQGPNKNILEVYNNFTKRLASDLPEFSKNIIYDKQTVYLGYSDVHGSVDIKKYVTNHIPNKNTLIYIVGHSLGAWNGAHLTNELKKRGYQTQMLITLDPVGEGVIVGLASDIDLGYPVVEAKQWINIRCEPYKKDSSDKIADFGEQWKPTAGFTYNVITKVSHWDALGIMNTSVINGMNAMDLLLKSIKDNLK